MLFLLGLFLSISTICFSGGYSTYLVRCFKSPLEDACKSYPSAKDTIFDTREYPLLGKSNKPIKWRGVSPRILIVTNTVNAHYADRAQVIRNTFMQRVNQKESLDLIFLGGPTTDGSPDMLPSGCKVDYWEDSCKKADMIVVAYEILKKNGGEAWDWFMFADDDALIIPDNLQRGIMRLDDISKEKTAVWGSLDCALVECRGICGGGGFFMNRDTLMQINEKGDKLKYPTFRDEIDAYHFPCGKCGDLAITEGLLNIRNIPVHQFFQGNHIWKFKSDDELLETLKQTGTLAPWLYHYGAKGRFPLVWEEVKKHKSSNDLDD